MALIEIRDIPDHIYRRLVEEAEGQRRSLAQQVVAVLARGLQVEVEPKARRSALLDTIRANAPVDADKLSDPAKLIREDRHAASCPPGPREAG